MSKDFNEPSQLIYDARSARELDRVAIDELGIPGIVLMKRAGKAVFSVIRSSWPNKNRLAIFCGAGNNGGDGYIVAGLALQSGLAVQLIETLDPGQVKGDAALARDFALAQGLTDIITAEKFNGEIEAGTVVVDALLGTGFGGEPRDTFARLITQINRAASMNVKERAESLPVVAVDIPSGLEASTGRASSATIYADMTVTFIGQKIGLYTGDGPDYVGKLIFNSLDVPVDLYSQVGSIAELLSLSAETSELPTRPASSHKGNNGHVLILGGGRGLGGAALMAATAAARMGAGLVSVVTDTQNVPALISRQPELMVRDASNIEDIELLAARATHIVVGPGLGTKAWGQRLMQLAVKSGKPLVLDADALNLIAKGIFDCSMIKSERVMTPHPGEAARLLSSTTTDIQSDRYIAVTELYNKYGGVQLLKGAGTLIASGDDVSICPYGNPGMGSGGMGDVLTGMIAGLWAQGLDALQAVRLAACLHSSAADILAARQGQRGMLATDLIPVARELLNGS